MYINIHTHHGADPEYPLYVIHCYTSWFNYGFPCHGLDTNQPGYHQKPEMVNELTDRLRSGKIQHFSWVKSTITGPFSSSQSGIEPIGPGMHFAGSLLKRCDDGVSFFLVKTCKNRFWRSNPKKSDGIRFGASKKNGRM